MTNGQIPSWLDTSNPKVSIVSHQEIFTNKQALPTFSSPSIEMNLHHIKGLSNYFIYFNDDVFLGSPVTPADFMSLEKGQILYTSWEVPECSEYCNYNQLGNGYCDTRCNNAQCGFDFGDCEIEASIGDGHEVVNDRDKLMRMVKEDEVCYETCSNGSLENEECDEECNRMECGYDAGECKEIDDHHFNLIFHCHLDELSSLNLQPISQQNLGRADYYVQQEYMIDPDSYCLARVIVDLHSYYTLHLPSVTPSLTIQSVECIEPGEC